MTPTRGRGRQPAGRRRSGGSDRGTERKAERGLGGDQVEGRQAVRELLLAGNRRVREVLVATGQDEREVLEDILELARGAGVGIREVNRGRLQSVARTENPQGVVALAAPLAEQTLEGLVTRGTGGRAPFLLAVDGVTDPGNLGALLRAAECAGVNGVLLPRHRAVHVTPTVTKAAAGAVEHLPMALVGGLASALRDLARLRVWTVGLDAAGSVPIWDLPVADEPVALVVGAEGRGLSRLVRQRCDALAAIPQLGQLSSLNVATAGAVACYEVARQRRVQPGHG